MKVLTGLLMVLVLLLNGCSGLKTADDVYRQTTSSHDPYKKATWVKGPVAPIDYTEYESSGSAKVFLRSNIEDDIHQLYLEFCGESWIFFNSAYDIDGNQLKFTQIDRHVLKESGIIERFVVSFSRHYLKSAAQEGLNMKFEGKRGERTVVLGPLYVQGYLKRLGESTAKLLTAQ